MDIISSTLTSFGFFNQYIFIYSLLLLETQISGLDLLW